MAEIRVGWRAHELKVRVSSDRTTYRVRQKAAIKIAVRKADGGPPPPGSEVALAAVDEGLLELLPNESWKLLEAMMGRRGYGVQTATASLAGAAQRVEWAQAPKGRSLAFPWPAKGEELTLEHAGIGYPWITVQAQAAIPLEKPLWSGYRISKTLAPIETRAPGRWSRGDLVRVRLAIEAQSDMTWVVVSDPIPAGASHLGTGLA